MAWADADAYEKGEHAPSLKIKEGVDITARPGQTLTIHAEAASADGGGVQTTFRIYREASAAWAQEACLVPQGEEAMLTIPSQAASGDRLHIIVKAQAEGHHRLVHYQQVIVTIA